MLPQAVRVLSIGACASVLMSGCLGHRFERRFLNGPVETRVDRLRQYSLEDQFKIFTYGMHHWHPPARTLATPIAERGATAIPFLSNQLEADTDSARVGDFLEIFERMTSLKTYDLKSDDRLMSLLEERVDRIKDPEWRRICRKNLNEIKNP